jgi:hypothetical protein
MKRDGKTSQRLLYAEGIPEGSQGPGEFDEPCPWLDRKVLHPEGMLEMYHSPLFHDLSFLAAVVGISQWGVADHPRKTRGSPVAGPS